MFPQIIHIIIYVGKKSWYIDSSYYLSGDDSLGDPLYIVSVLSYDTPGDDHSKDFSSNDEYSYDVFEFFFSLLSN